MKVYIGKMPDGSVIIDTNPQVLKDAEILATMPMEEYQALGHHSVDIAIEDGKPVVRLKDAVANKVKIAKIQARFAEIDRLDGPRPIREAVAQLASTAGLDTSYLMRHEAEASELRDQLAALSD